MSRNLRRAAVALAVCLSALAASVPARGDERKLVASLGVKDEHNDNLFFAAGGKRSSYVATLSPGLELSSRTERLDARLSAGASGHLYSTDDDLDALDQAYRGKLAYGVTTSLRLSADAAFRKDTRPDREIETSGLVVAFRSDRLNLGAGAEATLGERTQAGLAATYEKVEYDTTTRVDSEAYGGTMTLIHDLGRHLAETKGRAVLGYTRSEFTGVRVDNFTAALGASRGVTEKWSVLADLGARYTKSAVDVVRLEFVPPFFLVPVTTRENRDNFGWIANVALSYRGEKNRASLSFYRDVTAASGRQGATERTALVLEGAHRATEELSGSFSAGYYTNRSEAGEFSTQAIDERTVRVRPAVRYDFTKDIFAEAAYQHTRVRYRQSDASAAQNVVYAQVVIRYSIFE